jgi:alpha-beta hydrolase superfamily lysophospholipase
MGRLRPLFRRALTSTAWLTVILAGAVLVLALGWSLMSRDMPPLQPWHERIPAGEVTARDLDEGMTLGEFLRREAAVMREVRERIEPRTPDALRTPYNRFFAGSPLNPRHLSRDWNRTFELVPPDLRGGALLVHGMSDGPYSMRHLARILHDAGYYCLSLRMPGHGTVPAGLAGAEWSDWAAAVRMGVRHVRERIGSDRPLVLVGYSNGGALVSLYALETLENRALPRPDRLVLVSPMIGVTPFAVLSPVIGLFSRVPYFNRAAWTSVVPEYNPFKYNSFPVNGGYQSHQVTRALDRQLARAQEAGQLSAFPPVLAFQSIVDSTVVTGAVVDRFYDRLPANGSALVMFDLNRQSAAHAFMRAEVDGLFAGLFRGTARTYRVSVVTNASTGDTAVVEKDFRPGSTTGQDRPLALAWPPLMFSLSHVAVPFPVDDPLYGTAPDTSENYGVRLGRLDPRGERGVLVLSVDDLMRLTCNPFFPYMEERLREWVSAR